MFTVRSRFGIVSAALATTAFSLCPTARAQTFTIELINPPVAMASTKIKSISDDKSLMVQRLDSRGQVMEDYYIGFSPATNAYLAPTSLSFLGLEPGGLEREGRFAVGSVQGLGAALDLMTLRSRTSHLPTAQTSFIAAAQGGYGAGWIRNLGDNRHAAEFGIVFHQVVNDLHLSLAQQLGADWITSELLGIQVGNGYVGWGSRRNIPGHRALGAWGSAWVELHPSSFAESEALALFNDFQVGWGRDVQGLEHALVWQRTAASMISLNPPGSGNSRAVDMDSEGIAGYAKMGSVDHAAFWKRTALQVNGFGYIDLHQYLPSGSGNSVATGITGNGVIAGHFQNNNVWTPVLWHPIHLTGLTLSKTFFRGGTNVSATVRISRAAPPGGVTINVGPRNGLFLRTQVSTVTIPAGQTQTSFAVLSSPVFRRTTATVSATLGYEQADASATLDISVPGFP